MPLPGDIDNAMADIAAIFHWSRADMESLEPEELARWHERAIDRFKAIHGDGRR